MEIPHQVQAFLGSVKNISLGYAEFTFFEANNLEKEQIGYRVDEDGTTFITGNEGDWQTEWLVIAYDELGDPIIVDTSTTSLTVLCAEHGMGDWEPFVIADSLSNFEQIIAVVDKLSIKRTNPDEIEKNPIGHDALQAILATIEKDNPNAEILYWKNFFDDEF